MEPGASKSRREHLLAIGREYLTHWVIAGTFIVLTGFAPEHWVADFLSHLALPERIRQALQPALDIRVALVTIGVALIAWDVLRRSKLQKQEKGTFHASQIEKIHLVETPSRISEDQKSLQGTEAAPLPLPDKPSIAVLPFQNMSGDPEQEYFADGMAEDIITGLSRIKWLFVIARNSSFVYKGKIVDVMKVGRELGVRYVLEGSVRKAGHQVRLTGQLIDASTGAHIWADRYDGTLEDIFELQDKITSSVIGTVEPSLRRAEIERAKRKRPDSLDAYDLCLQALSKAYANTAADGLEALALLNQALRLEPSYALANGLAAWCHQQQYRIHERQENRIAALQHATAAISQGGDDATALSMAGFVLAAVARDYDAGISAIDQSLALNNSYAAGFGFSALVRAFAGQYEMAIEHALQAIRLNPLDPMGAMPYTALVFAYLLLGRFEDALVAVTKSIQLNPKFSISRALNVVALAKTGHAEAAREAAARLMELMPEFKVEMVTRLPRAKSEILADWANVLHQFGIQK